MEINKAVWLDESLSTNNCDLTEEAFRLNTGGKAKKKCPESWTELKESATEK